ncbi:MAG: hypothetical protein OXC48_04280 [Endozoicomonadaceae bacterium]|nr:hypothetical protein [Endozoicomonadaceae bacterium]
MAAMVATSAIDAGLFFTKKVPSSMAKMLTGRGDITLEDLNFRMFKMRAPTGKVLSVYRYNIREMLKDQGIFLNTDGDFFFLDYFYKICNLWRSLRSAENDLIACDTVCMLVAVHINRIYLHIDILQAFLDVKYAFMKSIAEIKQGLMNNMVKAIPDKYICSKYDFR